jgi:hypothetical protein
MNAGGTGRRQVTGRKGSVRHSATGPASVVFAAALFPLKKTLGAYQQICFRGGYGGFYCMANEP